MSRFIPGYDRKTINSVHAVI